MPDTSVSALDQRQQKLVENARTALEHGNWDYIVEATGHILKSAPGCVEARRLQRLAQMRLFEARNRVVAKVIGGLSATPFIFSSVTKDPHKALSNAEKILAADPTSSSALKLLADAAMALDYPETAAFAREAVQGLSPDDSSNLLELGEAWLAAGKPSEALTAADALLRIKPMDSAGQNLMRKAAVAQTANGWGLPGGRAAVPSAVAAGAERAPDPRPSEQEQLKQLGRALARVAAEPDHLDHYRSIVEAYCGLGQLTEALAWVRKARGTPAGSLDIGLEKQESEINGSLLEAQVREAESALVASPEDAEVRGKLDAVRRELGSFRFFEARRDVERFPADFRRRYAFAVLCLKRGQIDEAIGHFRAIQKDPDVRVAALAGLGRALKAKKQYDEAVGQFLLAKSERGPMSEEKKDIIYQLAECYEMMGRTDQAIAEYKALYTEDVGYRDVAKRINAYFNKG